MALKYEEFLTAMEADRPAAQAARQAREAEEDAFYAALGEEIDRHPVISPLLAGRMQRRRHAK